MHNTDTFIKNIRSLYKWRCLKRFNKNSNLKKNVDSLLIDWDLNNNEQQDIKLQITEIVLHIKL